MQTPAQENRDTISVLKLLIPLQDACERLLGDIADFDTTEGYQPKKDKNLWLALQRTFACWESALYDDAIASAGSNNYVEIRKLCAELAKINCDSNIQAQLTIAKALGLKLRYTLFWFSWRGNHKELKTSDTATLITSINQAIIEALMDISPETMQIAIMSRSNDLAERLSILELILQCLRATKEQQAFDTSLEAYRCSRMDILADQPASFELAEYPDSTAMLREYESLINMCQSSYYKPALDLLNIETTRLPKSEDDGAEYARQIKALSDKIQRAFYRYLVKLKTHRILINALACKEQAIKAS